MSEVDPRFLAARDRAKRRRRRRGRLRFGLAGLALCLVALGTAGWLTRDKWHFGEPARVKVALGGRTLEAVGDSGREVLSAFVNLPGDPMRLHLDRAAPAAAHRRSLPRPPDLPAARSSGDLVLLSDTMITGQEQVVTTLPSSQEDFAVFQAQRRGLQGADAGLVPEGGEAAPPAAATEGAPAGSDSSSVAVRPAEARAPLTEDRIQRITAARPLAEVLRESALPPTEAQAVAAAAASLLNVTDLAAGEVLALRGRRGPDGKALNFVQLSLYGADRTYIGTLARAEDGPTSDGGMAAAPADAQAGGESAAAPDEGPDGKGANSGGAADTNAAGTETAGTGTGTAADPSAPPQGPLIVAGADPWVGQDLFAYSAPATGAAPARQYRVLDAFYSAALRDEVPPTLVGEAIMLLSESNDLDVFAAPGDRMTLLYAPHPGAEGPGLGQILYIALAGANVTLDCYVYRPAPGQDYACYGKRADRGADRTADRTTDRTPAKTAPGGTAAQGDGMAIDQVADRIIQIESGGDASAKNALSTATGQGQFIESTWLRMMRTYRPDLMIANDRTQLLALRNNPKISRQMVALLAQEGETYLRARGHQVTAGRIYLAHFLGAAAANQVLDAAPDAPLLGVLGPGVLAANPFLNGQDCAYVLDWAERKMGGKAVFREPAGLDAFRASVTALLPAL